MRTFRYLHHRLELLLKLCGWAKGNFRSHIHAPPHPAAPSNFWETLFWFIILRVVNSTLPISEWSSSNHKWISFAQRQRNLKKNSRTRCSVKSLIILVWRDITLAAGRCPGCYSGRVVHKLANHLFIYLFSNHVNSGAVVVYTLRVNMSVAAPKMLDALGWTESEKGFVLVS